MENVVFKYIIDINRLHLGDIILAIFDKRIGEAMNRMTGSPFYHAMIVSGKGTVLHSDANGVHSANPMRMVFENPQDVKVVRYKNVVSKKLLMDAINSVRSKVGTSYSFEERNVVQKAGMQASLKPNRQFCTRLVAQAYRDVGLPLVANSDYCTPVQLLDSDQVFVISDILIEGNSAQLQYANEKSKVLLKQESATNFILERARNITNADIQNLSQLENFIDLNPSYDSQLTDVIVKSGYFDLIEMDIQQNPEYYCFKTMEQKIPKEYRFDLAIQQLPIAETMLNTMENELSRLEARQSVVPLEYNQKHIELQKKLINAFGNMANTMEKAMEEFLK